MRWVGQAILIIVADAWIYSPAFHGTWLWDDNLEITENVLLRGPAGLWKIWFASPGPDFFPLKTTLQWVQWQLWQNHPFGYHLTSVGLHLLGALLLWHLLGKLGVRLAWLGGLLFAVHPVAVESVAWIAELKNTLSLPLLLLALCAWIDYDGRGRRTDYLRAVLLFLAAMLCKSSVVMFPVILLLHAWWRRGRISRKDWRATAVFFAISLGLGLVTVWFQYTRGIGSIVIPVGGFLSRLAVAGTALGFYFSKCILPAGVLPIYPRWTVDPPSFLQFLPWPVAGAVVYALWQRRATWGRHALFGCGCFVVNLAPVLGFLTIAYMHITWTADHLVYLPLAGLAGLAAAGAGAMAHRLPASLRPAAGGAMALLVGLLIWQSHHYAGIFDNEKDLWTYTLQRNPEAWLAHSNLGAVLLQEGRLPEAISHYEAVLRLKPDHASTHSNLGYALSRTGRMPEAIAHYEEALRLRPDLGQAHNNLGLALVQVGRLPEAVAQYEEALRLQPELIEVHYNLGSALFQSGRVPEAVGQFEEAVRLRPDSAEGYFHLGNIMAQTGRLSEAEQAFTQALRLQPDNEAVRENLAHLKTMQQGAGPEN
jgi:tetratricopeptide (TPR) repeat protein